MPKTKFQSLIFTLIMVFFMVYSMTVYTVSEKFGGLSYRVFYVATKEMWLEYVIVFLLVFFAVSKIAQKLAFRIVNPMEDKPIFVILAVSSFTVTIVVPTITLIATFLHGGFTSDWFTRWISLAVSCFPVALCLQIFFVGPLVRKIFRLVFSRDRI